jgi:predicted anti-sigma-YlaC factor YlaD
MDMRCRGVREQLSARLDGEDDPAERAAVDSHLRACAECQRWFEGAARVTRMARTEVAQPTPDLVAAALAARPTSRVTGLRLVLRATLATIGLGQIALAIAAFGGAGGGAESAQLAGANLAHYANEFAAWNLALGVGFLWIAWRVGRAPGLAPTLAVFVVVLTALEVIDAVRGHVDALRVLSHSLVQVGFVVVLALMARRLGGDGWLPGVWLRRRGSSARPTPSSRDRSDAASTSHEEDGDSGLRPSARRNVA